MRKFLLFATLVFSVAIVTAHEGHDKTPGLQPTRPGGIIKGTKQIYLELVSAEKGVKIYPMDHEKKPIPLSELKLDGQMTIPRKNNVQVLKFVALDDHFAAQVDAKGAHRYDLEVSVTRAGNSEKIKFNVETQP